MRALTKLLFLLAAAALCSSSALADSFAYVVTGASQFGTVDLNNGAFNAIGPSLTSPSGGLVPAAGNIKVGRPQGILFLVVDQYLEAGFG